MNQSGLVQSKVVKESALDRPWHRPGALAYAKKRRRAAFHPPVTVYPMHAEVIKDEDVEVRMRDGVILRLNLFRPRGAGPFPVILSAHPYGKDNTPKKKGSGWSLNKQFRIMNQPEPLRISDQTSWEAPDPVWWVQQGYAVINLDTRGGGHSDGKGDLLSDQEADDISQVIAWAAEQSWSTGRVGMLGVSYLALSQYKVAALNPPALKAICPWEGFTDAYRDFFTPGGVVENGFARVWLFLTKHVARLETDFAKERRKHPLRDAWWEAITPDLSKIEVPLLECTSFSDDNLHSVGSMRAFQQAGSSERHAYAHRGPKWATFYGEQGRRAQLAFFDRHLREQDVALLPPLRLEIRDRLDHVVETRDEQDWPLARTDWRQLHLGADGALDEHEAAGDGSVTFDLKANAAAFNYTFDSDTEISGPMTVRLHVATTGIKDPRLFVGVEKWSHGQPVPFNGSYGYGRDRVAQGRLRLALREIDADRSRPHQVEHTFRTLEPVRDNEQMDIVIPLSSSATLFHAGDSLRLLIAGRYLQPRNPLFGHFPTHYEPSTAGKATIFWAPGRPSTLEIPVIPAAGPALTGRRHTHVSAQLQPIFPTAKPIQMRKASMTLLTARSQPPSLAPRSGTHAYVWGENPHGALGIGGSGRATTPRTAFLPDDLVTTAAGCGFSLGVTSAGQVWGWGTNEFGQLGDGTTTHRMSPVEVKLPKGTRVASVTAGRYHALAVAVDGSVWAWGRNQVGQLGDGTRTERDSPVRARLTGPVTELAAGAAHSLAIVRGRVLAWGGLATAGAVGADPGATVPTPVTLPRGVTAARMRTGANVTAILDTKGTVHIWGRHFGTAEHPTMLPRKAFDLGVGDSHVIALNSDGSLTSIGPNSAGELGDGTTTLRTEPVSWRLPHGRRPERIGVSGDHTVTLTRDARVYTWGGNRTGYLGDGTRRNAPNPVELTTLHGALVKWLAVGNFHALLGVGATRATSLRISVDRARERIPMRIIVHEMDAFGTLLHAVSGAWITVNGKHIHGDTFTPPEVGRYLIAAGKDGLRGRIRVEVSR